MIDGGEQSSRTIVGADEKKSIECASVILRNHAE